MVSAAIKFLMSEIDNLLSLLDRGQDNALLRFSLGNAYLKNGNYELASENFSKAVTFDPDYSAAWKLYARSLDKNGKTEKAIKTYQQGIKVAENKGDIQAAKEMKVFLKRLKKS